jgi:hypothetical protein
MCRISKQRIAVACWLACSGALAQAATPVVESAAANSVGTQIAITVNNGTATTGVLGMTYGTADPPGPTGPAGPRALLVHKDPSER